MYKCGTAIQSTDDDTIQRMRFACWITKAIGTHSEYVIITDFPRRRGEVNTPAYYVFRTPTILFQLTTDIHFKIQTNSTLKTSRTYFVISPLNAELNPIRHLPALLGAHHILHGSRVKVKLTNSRFCP